MPPIDQSALISFEEADITHSGLQWGTQKEKKIQNKGKRKFNE